MARLPLTLADRPIKRRLSGAARRERFLDAAAEIVVEQGVGAVTMEGAAARTAVDKRLGYKYFANRDALIDALLQREIAKITERTRALIPADPTYEDGLRATTMVWLRSFVESGPLMHRLVYDWHPTGTANRSFRQKAQAEWVATILTCFAIDRVEAEVIARTMLSALRGAVEAVEDGVAPVEQVAEIYNRVTLAGLNAMGVAKPDGAVATPIRESDSPM